MSHRFTIMILASALSLAAAVSSQGSDRPLATDVSQRFASSSLAVEEFRAIEVGGIVLLQGRAVDRASAIEAARIATVLGFARVANLIVVIEAPDDVRLQRAAERALASHRALEGCRFTVSSTAGVLRLGGHVYSEVQKDLAIEVLRNLDGIRSVTSELR